MQVVDYVISRFNKARSERSRMRVGICGRAGAGKTTLTTKIVDILHAQGIGSVQYSGDWRFILDSPERRSLLAEKWRVGIEAYVYAINQFNWWDFDAIDRDLEQLAAGQPVTIHQAYNRTSGFKDRDVKIDAIDEGVIFYENCVLGGVESLQKLDLIILLNTPSVVCFSRNLQKDASRRTLPEIAARYLMTTYSENIFLRLVLGKFESKLVSSDSDGRLGGYPEVEEVSHIPVPIATSASQPRTKATVFCDIDGTLIKHVAVPSESGEEIQVLDGAVEKLREAREKGYFIVLTTSRPQHKVFRVVDTLKNKGIVFDQIVCDLPVGPRHLINDSKDGQLRAFAHPIEPDQGINEVKLP